MLKSFGDHMDYVREVALYEKLRGTGLCPELTAKWDDNIEIEYIEGRNLAELMTEVREDRAKFRYCCGRFFDWYKEYRRITNLSIGEIDFTDFIVRGDDLLCYDFEHCRPGYAEDDVARLTAEIALLPDGYTALGLQNASTFIATAETRVTLISEKLYESLKIALAETAKKHGFPEMSAIDEYFASSVCCDYKEVPDGAGAQDIARMLEDCTHMWTLFINKDKPVAEKYIRYILSADKTDADAVFLTEHNSMIELPLVVRTTPAVTIMSLATGTNMNLRDVLILKMKCNGVPVENMNGYAPGEF